MGREKEPFQRRWRPQDGRRGAHEGEYEDEEDTYEDDLEYDEDDEYEVGDMQELDEKGSNIPRRRSATHLPQFPSTKRNIYPRASRARRMPKSTRPGSPGQPTQTSRSKRHTYLPDELQPPSRRSTELSQRPSQQSPRSDDLPRRPASLRSVPLEPRRRRVWPIFLIGCAAGAVSLVLFAAIVVLMAIHAAQSGGGLNIPGVTNTGKPYSQQTTRTLSLSALSQLIVCDPAGNISLSVDPNPNATDATVEITKTVTAANQKDANQTLEKIVAEVQSPNPVQNALTCQKPETTNASSSNRTPTATSTANNNNTTLSVNVTLPANQAGQTPPTVDLAIKLPGSLVQTPSPTNTMISIDAPDGNINANGVSGIMQLKGGSGDIIVQHAVIVDTSRITTEGNVTFNGYLDTQDITHKQPPDQPEPITYTLDSGHQLDVTLSGNENIVLDARTNTNTGKIVSDFFTATNNCANGLPSYCGPLNPGTATNSMTPLLNLQASIGNISIHKGKAPQNVP